MPFFRKKPIVVKAVQITKEMSQGDKPMPPDCKRGLRGRVFVQTLDGQLQCRVGDWIVTAAHGGSYPVKKAIFAETFEALTDEEVKDAGLREEELAAPEQAESGPGAA